MQIWKSDIIIVFIYVFCISYISYRLLYVEDFTLKHLLLCEIWPAFILKLFKCPQQTLVGLEDVFKTSSRHVLKTSSTRLQRNNFTSSKTSWRRLPKTSWRRLEDLLQDVLKMSWKTKNCYAEDVLKTCLEDMSWRHALKTCLEDMSWRNFKDFMETKKILTGDICIPLGITNLNVYLTNLYFTNLYLAILRRIQNALIRTQ